MLNKINVNHIIFITDHEPNFLDMFGERYDQVNDKNAELNAMEISLSDPTIIYFHITLGQNVIQIIATDDMQKMHLFNPSVVSVVTGRRRGGPRV